MTDHATPNLPSRDFDLASRFFSALGFVEGWRDGGWMIMTRGALKLEFFPNPTLDPLTSSFGWSRTRAPTSLGHHVVGATRS